MILYMNLELRKALMAFKARKDAKNFDIKYAPKIINSLSRNITLIWSYRK